MDLLVSVNSLPDKYQKIFPKYRYFNRIQSSVYPHIFDAQNSIVVSAPTSSGKTAIFEMAIIKYLMEVEAAGTLMYDNCKIVMVAPMKAICNERYRDWKSRFTYLNLKILLLTGTTDTKHMFDLNKYNIIITTPEKWDSTMRQWNIHKDTIQKVDLFMIDEVQLVGDKSRGPTLEAIVSRMKNIQIKQNSLRIIAATATASNLEDISEWLGSIGRHCRHFSFDESTRPVPLKIQVLGFPGNQTYFRFDLSLNYKLGKMILDYSEKKPTLVFCCTRSGVEMAAKQLVQSLTATLTIESRKSLHDLSCKLSHPQAKNVIKHGIGIHHAGILEEELQLIEDAFRREILPVLVATTTLAMGVNLPAHLVIIKGTKMYNNGEFISYSDTQIQQMIGRAGRPQYDTSAIAIIMTTNEDKVKYHNMLHTTAPLESGLHLQLTEHLNSEIVLRSLTDIAMCMHWLSTTFLYVRASKNPHYYGLNAGLSKEQLVRRLLQLCQIDINKLTTAGMVIIDENAGLTPTFLGELMAKYYIQFETVKNLALLHGTETMPDILQLVCKSKEFEDMYLRVSEKKVLNLLNESRTDSIRFPMTGKIKNIEMKTNCLLQAVLGCLPITDHGLVVESEKVMKSADSIVKCMLEYLLESRDKYSALYATLLLSKSIKAHLWENSSYVAKQLPGIGAKRARLLAEFGKTTFTSLALTGPNALNAVLKSNIGENIVYLSGKIPKYEMEFKLKNGPLKSDAKVANLEIIIQLTNKECLTESVVDFNSQMTLLVGNVTKNQVVFHNKLTHNCLYTTDKYVKSIDLRIESRFEKVILVASFISSNWIGFDVTSEIILNNSLPSTSKNNSPQIKQKTTILDYFGDGNIKKSSSNENYEIHEILSLNDKKDQEANIQTCSAIQSQKQTKINTNSRKTKAITVCDIFGPELLYSKKFRDSEVSNNLDTTAADSAIKNTHDIYEILSISNKTDSEANIQTYPADPKSFRDNIVYNNLKMTETSSVIKNTQNLNSFPIDNANSVSSCKTEEDQMQDSNRSKPFTNNKFDPTLNLSSSNMKEWHNIDVNVPTPSELFAMFNIPTLQKSDFGFGNKHKYAKDNNDPETIDDSGINSMKDSERCHINVEDSEMNKQGIYSIFGNLSNKVDVSANGNELEKSQEEVTSNTTAEHLNITSHEHFFSDYHLNSDKAEPLLYIFNSPDEKIIDNSIEQFNNSELNNTMLANFIDNDETNSSLECSMLDTQFISGNTQNSLNNTPKQTFSLLENNFLEFVTTQSLPKNNTQASINFEKKLRNKARCDAENRTECTHNNDEELSPKSFVSAFKGKSKFQNPSLLTQDDLKSNSISKGQNLSLFVKAPIQSSLNQRHSPSQSVLNKKVSEILNPSSFNISQIHPHIPFQSGYNNNGYTITQSKLPTKKPDHYSIFREMDTPSTSSQIPSMVYKKTSELSSPTLHTTYNPMQPANNYPKNLDEELLYLNSIANARIPKYDYKKQFNHNATTLYDQPDNTSFNNLNASTRKQEMEVYQTYLMNKHRERSTLDDSQLQPYYASEYLSKRRSPSPPAPYEFSLRKKPKLRHKLRPKPTGSRTVVCDVIKTSRKSIMWASPLVTANSSSGTDDFNDFINDSKI